MKAHILLKRPGWYIHKGWITQTAIERKKMNFWRVVGSERA